MTDLSGAATPVPAPAKELRVPDSPFYVPALLHVLGGLVDRHRDFWLWLAGLESRMLAEQLRSIRVTMPIYLCGLARSGTTLVHEIVASHPSMATHRIKDYPMVFTPYWWRRATAKLRPRPPHERPHHDRVMITTESPDAIEEMLWTAFFPRCHDPAVSSVLTAAHQHSAFEAFYDAHIRKLLLAERAQRYVTKANYHVARLGYLLRLFPDARFVIPVRAPAAHIASLLRQHRWFSTGHRKCPRALAYMQRSGHFEFGLDRRPMNLGDGERVRRIVQTWAAGDETRGLAEYWDMVYGYLGRLLATDDAVRKAALVLRFETLCDAPAETLRDLCQHCAVPQAEPLIARYAGRIHRPDYYRHSFSPRDLAVIHAETADTARLWGY